MRNEQDDSILLTLSQKTIKERKGGYRAIIKEWLASDGENQLWYYKTGVAPKNPESINYVYWVIGGRIRWRSRLLEVLKLKRVSFQNSNKTHFAKRWLVMFDFEAIPKCLQIEKKGFQGFRYFNSQNINQF